MKWDVVTISCSVEIDKNEIKHDLEYLKKLKILEEVLVVNDACENVGSGGSTLNALLVTTERLCALRGYTVLSDNVLEDSNILIVLVGSIDAIIKTRCIDPEETENGYIQSSAFIKSIQNATKMAEKNDRKGLWIIGTESAHQIDTHFETLDLRRNSITTFCFECPDHLKELHGYYSTDEENKVTKIEYCTNVFTSTAILAFLYLPPSISSKLLSFIDLYPVSASTYYGIDSGLVGLKLSLFFDFIQSTCSTENEYLNSCSGGLKIEKNNVDLLKRARKLIYDKFSKLDTFVCKLDVLDYQFQNFGNFRRSLPELHERIIYNIQIHFKLPQNLEKLIKSAVYIKTILNIDNEHDYFNVLSKQIHGVELHQRPQVLFSLSLGLSIEADCRGGLRSGPVANPEFSKILENLKSQSIGNNDIQKLFDEIQKNWRKEESLMIRAARHLEAAGQIYISKSVEDMCKNKTIILPANNENSGKSSIKVSAPARVDLYGGWLDTPPIFFAFDDAAVCNMAILVDGKRPISCEIEKISKPVVELVIGGMTMELSERLDSYNRPTRPGCLLSACIVALGYKTTNEFCGVLKTPGLRVTLTSDLPHGSGLGTSSILAATILKAIVELGEFYIPNLEEKLILTVLKVEQLMTTGGGWQDQVGAVYPGIKFGIAEKQSNFAIRCKKIGISKKFEEQINNRLVLVYTGKTRLAKNILQEVIRNWYKDGEIKQVLYDLWQGIPEFYEFLLQDKFPVELIDRYYAAKKVLTSGCEPQSVKNLLSQLKSQKLIETGWLAGAGGGGFCYIWLTESSNFQDISKFLCDNSDFCDMSCHFITISNQAFDVRTWTNK